MLRVVPVEGGVIAATSQECGTVTSPCGSLQQAVDLAQSGDQVWLAKGVYTGSGDAVITITGDKHLTFIGGFDATNWQPDATSETTIIDGDGVRRAVFISDTYSTVSFENVIIRNGLGQHPPGELGGRWGAVCCACKNASVYLRDVTFSNNKVQGPDTATVWRRRGGFSLGWSRRYLSGHYGERGVRWQPSRGRKRQPAGRASPRRRNVCHLQ